MKSVGNNTWQKQSQKARLTLRAVIWHLNNFVEIF